MVDVGAWRRVRLGEPLADGNRSRVFAGTGPDGPVVVRHSRRSIESLRWELDLLVDLDRAGFLVPTPMRTDDGELHDGAVVVQPWIDGRPPSTEADWRAVAEELQRLHRFGAGRGQRPEAMAVSDLAATGDSARSVDADLALLPAGVTAEVMAVFASVADVDRSVIHGDPGPDNIRLSDDGRVGLIDWDESRVDVVYHDLSNLGTQVLDDGEHQRALRLSHAWEAANAWTLEPDYARHRLTRLRAIDAGLGDWVRAPNIAGDQQLYELENEAIARDGRLDRALFELAPWTGARLVDIGCGTGFWLPRYAETAGQVIGVEPDPDLVTEAAARAATTTTIEVRRGSAEHLPLADDSVDIAHARFAYFFGPGAEAGLAEVGRVLAPGGSLVVVDNSWTGGDFARLLRASAVGNAAFDPELTVQWWADQGATRHEVYGGWAAKTRAQLDRILRIEFPATVVDEFMADHDSAALTYRFALYHWPAPNP